MPFIGFENEDIQVEITTKFKWDHHWNLETQNNCFILVWGSSVVHIHDLARGIQISVYTSYLTYHNKKTPTLTNEFFSIYSSILYFKTKVFTLQSDHHHHHHQHIFQSSNQRVFVFFRFSCCCKFSLTETRCSYYNQTRNGK